MHGRHGVGTRGPDVAGVLGVGRRRGQRHGLAHGHGPLAGHGHSGSGPVLRVVIPAASEDHRSGQEQDSNNWASLCTNTSPEMVSMCIRA